MSCPIEIIVLVLIVTSCSARMDPNDPNVQACFKENGVDVIEHGKMFPPGSEHQSKPELRCVLKCLLERRGRLKPDGTLDYEKMEAMMKEDSEFILPEKISEFLECIKKIDKIETCDDISKLRPCNHLLNHQQ